jgi:bifunctional non-homologous end joining protein LigD
MRPPAQERWPPTPIEQIRLMGAVAQDFPLHDQTLIYEPKYDGVRVKVAIMPRKDSGGITIWSRQENVLTSQFPDLVADLNRIRHTLKHPVLTDGEIVAVDDTGSPLKFEDLQSRLGLLRPTTRQIAATPVALILFDVLLESGEDLRSLSLVSRRARLEAVFQRYESNVMRLSRMDRHDGRRLLEEAKKHGWEGIVAKRAESPYRSGKHHDDWRKLKLLLRQEFVVGGWTESDRRPFRALLIGVYDNDGHFHYVGRMGKAFSDRELKELSVRLRALEILHSPFADKPEPDAKPHWVKPELVIEAKFNEWTGGGKLREPTYIGLRTDVNPTDVRREQIVHGHVEVQHAQRQEATSRIVINNKETSSLLAQVNDLEERGGSGVLTFATGHTLSIDGLSKMLWRGLGLTKADLMRYYIRVSRVLLPTIQDRPLTYRPFPHGVHARPDRYHQRVKHLVPQGVRVEPFRGSTKEYEPRFIGGLLVTLLYMVQHHVISQDAWLSTVQTPDYPDVAVIDLDPMPDVPFQQVADVAHWLHDELEGLGVPHFLKTSGSSGLHVYMPLGPNTSFRQAWEFCQLLGQIVTTKHPHHATIERSVSDRGKRVYLDYLQNLPGKTLATAYSVRANAFAGVSTPLRWDELRSGVRPEDFTMRTIVARIRHTGDLWARLRHAPGIDLNAGRL